MQTRECTYFTQYTLQCASACYITLCWHGHTSTTNAINIISCRHSGLCCMYKRHSQSARVANVGKCLAMLAPTKRTHIVHTPISCVHPIAFGEWSPLSYTTPKLNEWSANVMYACHFSGIGNGKSKMLVCVQRECMLSDRLHVHATCKHIYYILYMHKHACIFAHDMHMFEVYAERGNFLNANVW